MEYHSVKSAILS